MHGFLFTLSNGKHMFNFLGGCQAVLQVTCHSHHCWPCTRALVSQFCQLLTWSVFCIFAIIIVLCAMAFHCGFYLCFPIEHGHWWSSNGFSDHIGVFFVYMYICVTCAWSCAEARGQFQGCSFTGAVHLAFWGRISPWPGSHQVGYFG